MLQVWYGVPAASAGQLEAALQDALPQLFPTPPLIPTTDSAQPLLPPLAQDAAPQTLLSPMELRRRGVPVFRWGARARVRAPAWVFGASHTMLGLVACSHSVALFLGCPANRLVQEPGSFVVTFPAAHHAHLDAGFNVAESVNFAPADWLPHAADALRRYRAAGRAAPANLDGLLLRLVAAAPAVAAAQQAAAALHSLRPSEALSGFVKTEPLALARAASGAVPAALPQAMQMVPVSGMVQMSAVCGAGAVGSGMVGRLKAEEEAGPGAGTGPVACKLDPAAVAAATATYAAQAAAAAAGSSAAGGAGGAVAPYSWQQGVSFSTVPPTLVAAAVGELTLRLEEEGQRRAAAREAGVVAEQCVAGEAAGGGAQCPVCRDELCLSAVTSGERPGAAACPVHVSALGATPSSCTLLVR